MKRRNILKAGGTLLTTPWMARPARAASPVHTAPRPRGVVFLVSDGMSPGVFTLAEEFSKMTRKRSTAWWQLHNTPSAQRGLMDTASANSMVTDSAAASSAWGCGHRVDNGAVNFTPDGKEQEPIAKLLKRTSRTRIGLVTTATITHATPAGFAAAVPDREQQDEIAPQYLDRVDVLLGGGADHFDPATRKDRANLRDRFAATGYALPTDAHTLATAKSPKLLGLFAKDHLPFHIDRGGPGDPTPPLATMTRAALSRFLADDSPFLLQIEGARIDHAAHLNDIGALLADQLEFDDAVAEVLAMTAARNDILVVVTSDHGNSNPGLNGVGLKYRGSNGAFARILRQKSSHEALFKQWMASKERDSATLATLVRKRIGFAMEKAETAALLNVLSARDVTEWNHLLEKPEGLLGQFAGNHTGIGWTGTTHTSDPTLLTATGPEAARFAGVVRNSDVFGHLVSLLG